MAQLDEMNADLQCENLQLKDQVHEKLISTQVEQTSLLSEHMSLDSKVDRLQLQLGRAASKLGANVIKGNDEATRFYTGLPSYQLFYGIFEMLKPLISTT